MRRSLPGARQLRARPRYAQDTPPYYVLTAVLGGVAASVRVLYDVSSLKDTVKEEDTNAAIQQSEGRTSAAIQQSEARTSAAIQESGARVLAAVEKSRSRWW